MLEDKHRKTYFDAVCARKFRKMDEKEYEKILQYLKCQTYPDQLTENEKRRIRAKKTSLLSKHMMEWITCTQKKRDK